MPRVSASEINTQQFRRNFIQHGGPRPNNTMNYAGLDGQYMVITDLTINDTGSVNFRRVPDPFTPGGLRTVARSTDPADPDEATIQLLEKKGTLPWFHNKQRCAFNIYELPGDKCTDISDFNSGWKGYKRVLSYAEVSTKSFSALQDWESDEQNTVELAVTLEAVYSIGALQFGLKAESTIAYEVVDVVFGRGARCGDCGVPNDGTNFIYALVKGASSPATKPAVVYSVDKGSTWASVSIATAATNEPVVGMDIVGDKLVVLSSTGGTGSASALYVSTLNTVTGAPSSTFTKVTPSAFTVANTITDIYVLSPGAVFFSAAGGYIYKSKDVLSDMSVVNAADATAQNLTRIFGVDQVIYAVGASATVIKSVNGGDTFAATTTSPGAAGLTAVSVLDAFRAWVGNSSGAVYYTVDGGENWTLKTVTSATATAIKDIVFATDEVGLVAFTISGPAGRIASTENGGERWNDSTNSTVRLGTLPTIPTINRIAFPSSNDPTVNVNAVLLGGLGATTDGALALGTVTRF